MNLHKVQILKLYILVFEKISIYCHSINYRINLKQLKVKTELKQIKLEKQIKKLHQSDLAERGV